LSVYFPAVHSFFSRIKKGESQGEENVTVRIYDEKSLFFEEGEFFFREGHNAEQKQMFSRRQNCRTDEQSHCGDGSDKLLQW
jgi:hypothetical protein